MVSLNINDEILVRLTDSGKAAYIAHYRSLKNEMCRKWPHAAENIQITPPVDDDGFTRMQIWQFMEVFGLCMCHVCETPTVGGRIYFREEDLVDYG